MNCNGLIYLDDKFSIYKSNHDWRSGITDLKKIKIDESFDNIGDGSEINLIRGNKIFSYSKDTESISEIGSFDLPVVKVDSNSFRRIVLCEELEKIQLILPQIKKLKNINFSFLDNDDEIPPMKKRKQ